MAESPTRPAGRLTTHVLDTTHGRPGADMAVALYRLGDDGARERIASARTNADGRCDAPLMAGETMRPGRYELVFEVAAYFRACRVALPDPPFLDEVRLQFGIAEPGQHYHVPLLVSPFAYSTYRGS
ncbi:hydroxyisourate hydrolase [Chelatococcus sp. SYSU_G07232]|uniref:5-hydroxyisourate hydrolase n=1 Tax=Chelatococcus albus TaxID=3047466 RepID=A0ABT7ACF0_9HYPH|nr:hydroxyisourate hydrolase [Chelatococcus sp. SYSU_G07232]MDJ1157053.1 hydroxyisourate hydrolase [Chelatococcus sp. SYSU_G07232]